jgi:hypothetical protein
LRVTSTKGFAVGGPFAELEIHINKKLNRSIGVEIKIKLRTGSLTVSVGILLEPQALLYSGIHTPRLHP